MTGFVSMQLLSKLRVQLSQITSNILCQTSGRGEKIRSQQELHMELKGANTGRMPR